MRSVRLASCDQRAAPLVPAPHELRVTRECLGRRQLFRTDVADDDNLVDYSGVRVVVDASSAELLQGATLDYKDGLQGAGFAIENPNAQRSCGCGKSFS